MNLNDAMLERIRNINWFENCGMKSSIDINTPIVHVDSWSDAKRFYTKTDWSNVKLEARNELSQYLHDNFREQFRAWNTYVGQVNVFLDTVVTPKIISVQNANKLGKWFFNAVNWDILNAIMEDIYKQFNHNQSFYNDLLSVYEAGHFPCGWSGEYPNGSLLVY